MFCVKNDSIIQVDALVFRHFLFMFLCRLWIECKSKRLPRSTWWWRWLCWLWFTAVIRFYYQPWSQWLCVLPNQHDRGFLMNWQLTELSLFYTWLMVVNADHDVIVIRQKICLDILWALNLGLFIAFLNPWHLFTVVFFRCHWHHDQRMETW